VERSAKGMRTFINKCVKKCSAVLFEGVEQIRVKDKMGITIQWTGTTGLTQFTFCG